MVLLKHQPWNLDPGRTEFPNEVEWNMWTTRAAPFGALAEGSTVYLVSGGGPKRGLVTWEVVVIHALSVRYESKDDAWRQMRSALAGPLKERGYTRRSFLENDYTMAAPEQGYLLAWSYDPVRPIGLPRPEGLRFRQNGWTDVAELTFGGGESPNGGTATVGQGRIADPVLRKMIELHAMERARQWLLKRGHAAADIEDTSADCPYDLAAYDGNDEILRVEVKGQVNGLGPVFVTRGEVEATREGVPSALFIAHSISAVRTGAGWEVSGGTDHVVERWLPMPDELTVVNYRYDPR